MLEGFITNIKRKFTKSSEELPVKTETSEKTGFKRGLRLLKLKLTKNDTGHTPVVTGDDTALSPRAIGIAECAQTEIEWTILKDNNPNILDKFTKIVTISAESGPHDTNVIICHVNNRIYLIGY